MIFALYICIYNFKEKWSEWLRMQPSLHSIPLYVQQVLCVILMIFITVLLVLMVFCFVPMNTPLTNCLQCFLQQGDTQ